MKTDDSIDLALIVRHEHGNMFNVDAILRRSTRADEHYLATARPVHLDARVLNTAWPDSVQYGTLLSAQFFADETFRTAWKIAQSLAQSANLALRVRLALDPRVNELHSLGWETLTDPYTQNSIAMNERVRFARYIGTAELARMSVTEIQRPHALLAIANPTGLTRFNLAPLDVANEVVRMQTALGDVSKTILAEGHAQRASLNQIRIALREAPAIFCLICHGTWKDEHPYLWLEDDNGQIARVSGDEFINMIKAVPTPPSLIILGTCRSSGDNVRVLPAIAPRLVVAGIPAVIGAQGDISMATIATALPELMRELRRDGHVDRALAAARTSVGTHADWWRLVLWMHTRNGQIWQIPVTPVAEQGTARPSTALEQELAINCSLLRCSFIWVETFRQLPPPTQTAALEMSSQAKTIALFDAMPSADAVSLPDGIRIMRPWPKLHGQHFWYTYLERRPLAAITGKDAFRHVVPIRVLFPWELAITGFDGTLELEGFCYPHGVACIISLSCTEQLNLSELIQFAPMLRRAGIVTLRQSDNLSSYTLTDLAEMTLSTLTQLRTGEATARGHGVALEPFSVATIIRGTGAMTTLPPSEGGAIHSALEALTRWQIPPGNRRLTDLAQARILLGTADVQAGDVLYGHARSRAIWMPRHFTQTQTRASLGCYHRNLVWTALQIDSVGSLVKRGATLIAAGKALRGTQRTMLQRAYGILSRFHSGSSEVTYRTLSSKHHLEDNDMISALNTVREAFQRPPL